MAFSTKKGRPKTLPAAPDEGTAELRAKRRLHLTGEPLDALLTAERITSAQHRAGMHFRWLYTLCFGSPLPVSHEAAYSAHAGPIRQDCLAWREQREAEYRAAAFMLQSRALLRCVQNCCLYHEMPADTAQALRLQHGLEQLRVNWGF